MTYQEAVVKLYFAREIPERFMFLNLYQDLLLALLTAVNEQAAAYITFAE